MVFASSEAERRISTLERRGGFAVATGTMKWFNPAKGYAFIQPQDGGNDVFAAVERAGLSTLTENQK
jgi:hypothetical protein